MMRIRSPFSAAVLFAICVQGEPVPSDVVERAAQILHADCGAACVDVLNKIVGAYDNGTDHGADDVVRWSIR